MNKQISVVIVFYTCLCLLVACKHEGPGSSDLLLLGFARENIGYTWYKKSDQLLARATASGHTEGWLRTRYNQTASAVLDSNGKVKSGSIFPNGSVIVKELYSSPGSLSTYAVLYKQAGHADADIYGWVWGYIRDNGTVREPAANKGKACQGCHSQPGHIDLSLMNLSHP